MNAKELYNRLDDAGLHFEIVENFEGCRILRFLVEEIEEPETVTIKAYELTGAALDWAVAKCEDHTAPDDSIVATWGREGWAESWEMAGPIIQREGINVFMEGGKWQAYASHSLTRNFSGGDDGVGNPLVAAMRCYVGAVLGEDVEIPANLLEEV